ncbi:MAG TPA: hypothetical protein VGQ15_01645 [Gaiellaceae bacterium]|nr:hypothetical protein [Gaiellaceae bacterium]
MSDLPTDEPDGPEVEPEPRERTYDLAPGRAPFDAQLETKRAWELGGGTLPSAPAEQPLDGGEAVEEPFGGVGRVPSTFDVIEPPPIVAATAPGSRDPRRAAAVAGVDPGARHNWILNGPRNVGGRVSAFAVHPTDPRIMFAGAASGGVYRTRDGAETWIPLPFWHSLPSLAIGAIGICRDHPNTIYVATGEVQTGGGEAIPGNGVYRSDDGGDTWVNQNPSVPPVPGAAPNQAFAIEAIAVHPTDPQHCWAVGPAGVFRTLNGGQAWTQFEPGIYYSDVAFSISAGPGPHPILYLVRADASGAFVIRLDNPGGAGQPEISAVANRTRVVASPGPAAPAAGVLQQPPDSLARAKIAISASRPDIAYVRVVTGGGTDCNGQGAGGRHFGIFRTRSARLTPVSGIPPWVRLRDHLDWQCERQGTYNLTLAVDPTDPNNVVTGMVDLYLSRNANAAAASVRWLRAMAWELYQLDRAHHGDHHVALFAPQPGAAAAPPALWVANDGGISRSLDWRTGSGYPGALRRPLGPGRPPVVQASLSLPIQGVDGNGVTVPQPPISWRKRSHGVSASQMYDLTQSPLVPTLYGCGFQDNGVYVTSGSETWRFVLGADGGFVAFDPDDPYRLLATFQSGIDRVEFPGRLEGTFPVPGEGIVAGVWPRDLHEGFGPTDGAAFVADTAHHPRKSGRVLHARLNRLYGLPPRGERWQQEQVGPAVEIFYQGNAASPRIEVLDSPAARDLGLAPQLSSASVRTRLSEPFTLTAGHTLALLLDGGPLNIVFNPGIAIPDLAHATAAQVAAYIRANAPGALPTVTAQPFFPPTGLTVEITTRGVGPARQITLGGSAVAPPGAGALPRLGLLAGTYAGAPGRPASVTLGFPGNSRADFVRNRNLTGLELTIQIDGGAVRNVRFAPPAIPDPAWVRTGELAAAIRAALTGDAADVTTRTVFKVVRLTDLGGLGVQVSDTAADRLNMPSGGAFGFVGAFLFANRDRFRGQNAGNFNSFDLTSTGAALQLVISDNTNPPSPPLVFNAAAGAANLRCVTAEELQRIIAAHIAAIPAPTRPQVRCDLVEGFDIGTPRVIRYAESDPDVVWVGGDDGYLAVSTNDGAGWTPAGDPRFRLRDRSVSAIAIDPRDRRTVYVGLAGRTLPPAGDPGFLWKTTNAGGRWEHVGADVHDSTGALVGVNALEIDTGAPDTVFAATDVGVFRSIDGGAHWAPFNEGLPNVYVRDLAFVPSTRILRAGAWGRGVFERHVGARPPKDVELYVRQSGLDDGSGRPAPDGPDPFATSPRPAGADAPDIKVNRDRPPGIGADEVVDGVEFDEDVVHEEPVAGASHVFVQVHNRGSFPATGVRLVALWADAANGPPLLPGDFWKKFSAAGAIAGALAPWTLIGDTRAEPGPPAVTVEPGYPRVHTFDVNWPNDVDGMRRVGILLLVSSAEDAVSATALDIEKLLAAESKIAYRETPVTPRAVDHAFFLKQTGPAQFTVANPPAGTSAAAGLGIAPAALGAPAAELAGGSEPFNLAPAPQALTVSTPPQTLSVGFVQGPNDIPNLGAAQRWEVAAVLNREFELAGMPVRAHLDPIPAPPPPNNFRWALVLHGAGGATVAVAPPAAPAVDAAPVLGLAAGPPANTIVGGSGPFALAVGSAVQVTAANGATISLDATAFADAAHATAREVRRALNRGLAQAQLPIRAIVPKVDLRIRRSITDADGAPARVAGRRLADLAPSLTAVAAADRPALFDFVAMLKDGLVQGSHDNHLYLRTANLGTAAEPSARHRLFQLVMGEAGITKKQIGADVTVPVPAGGFAIVEFTWNPGAAAAGDRVFVLAVVDVDTDPRKLDPPDSFPTVDALDAFCDAHVNAAYREFTVVS